MLCMMACLPPELNDDDDDDAGDCGIGIDKAMIICVRE